MKLNKYLKELGLTWEDLPGNYIPKTAFRARLKRRWYKIKCGICYSFSALEDYAPEYNAYFNKPAFEKSNKENNEGFCRYEFFSLDYSLALYIYPRLCEFKEKYAKYGTPCYFCFDENGKQYPEEYDSNGKWLEVLDKMILAFKLIIKDDAETIEEDEKNEKLIKEGLDLFAKYYRSLWW